MSVSSPLLDIQHVSKSFGHKVIHRDVSFQLFPREMLGLLGNSGTGKSVLLRSIIGLERVDSGMILALGKRIDQLSETDLYPIRTRLSYAFQSGALFDSQTVFDNVAYPLREHRTLSEMDIQDHVMKALRLVHMEHAAHLMPSDLSGGMQKRAGLARAFVLKPEVILYDEPTAGLDPMNVENVLEVMNRFLEEGIAGIFVTHDIAAALKVCHRILILDEGKVAFSGTPQEFREGESPLLRKFKISGSY